MPGRPGTRRRSGRAPGRAAAGADGDGTTDGAADTRAVVQGPLTDGESMALPPTRTTITGNGRRRPAHLGSTLSAASDPPDTLSDEVQAAGTSKRGPLDRIDLKTILAVEMFDVQLEEILRAKRATIRVIIEPRDQRGWAPVRAVSVLTSNSAEGPWPGQSTIRRDDDERR